MVPRKNPLAPLHAQSPVTFLFSTAYFAPVSYYAYLLRCDKALMNHFHEVPCRAVVEQHEHYHKQTYRNRCLIATANGPLSLSVPVIKKNDQPVRDVRIDYRSDWQRLHWQSIASAYNTTPYFEYYQDDLRPLFVQRPGFLFDLNESVRKTVCRLLDLHPDLTFSEDYLHEGAENLPDGVTDLRNAIHPKKVPDGSLFTPAPYTQVFEERFGFQPDLSILDLLLNKGPESLITLKNCYLKTTL